MKRSVVHYTSIMMSKGSKGNAQQMVSCFEFCQVRKPLIEKKRRDRINNSLTQLKTLLTQNITHHVSNYTQVKINTIFQRKIVNIVLPSFVTYVARKNRLIERFFRVPIANVLVEK